MGAMHGEKPSCGQKSSVEIRRERESIPQTFSFLLLCNLWPVPPIGLLTWGPGSERGWEMPAAGTGQSRPEDGHGGEQ